MKKEMLINVLQPEECRIAILEDGVLEELYVERTSHESYVGNIYKGRIVNIEPSIQAAFVDFGVGRNGFLHVSDVEPAYFRHLEQGGGREDRNGDRGNRGDRGDRGDRRGGGRSGGRDRERDSRSERPAPPPPLPYEQEPAFEPESAFEPEPVPTPFPTEPPAQDPVSFGSGLDVPEVSGFGAGIFIDVEIEEITPVADQEDADSDPPSAGDPQLTALPDTQLEDEPAPRKRSRGGRRKKGPAGDAGPDDGDPKPPLMESAEHRTTDRDPAIDPLDSGSHGSPDDDLLFFPRSNEPPPPPVIQEPEPEPEAYEPEPPPFVPPSRPRPAVRSHRSIEDDLAPTSPPPRSRRFSNRAKRRPFPPGRNVRKGRRNVRKGRRNVRTGETVDRNAAIGPNATRARRANGNGADGRGRRGRGGLRQFC